jgi:BirA family biotin operon repressor/biotin-[acetyl-CoA-carboxylase] ligase
MKVHYFPQLGSTNDKAAELRRAGDLFAPSLVLTAEQTAGRGRGANRWFSSAGSLTVTFCLPIEDHLQPHQLPLIAGLAVRSAAAELTGQTDISLKWPNDVVRDGRKLAGLLCERINGVDLLGIGLNANIEPADLPDTLRYGGISLATIAGRRFDLTDTLILLSVHLRRMLLTRHSQPFAAFVEEYRQYDYLLGKSLTISPGTQVPLEGQCEGIDAQGRLLLRSGGKVHHIIAGTVRLMNQAN